MNPIKIQIVFDNGEIKTIPWADLAQNVRAEIAPKETAKASHNGRYVYAPSPLSEVRSVGQV